MLQKLLTVAAAMFCLVSTLHAQPAPQVELRIVQGRPTVLENGKPVVMAAYDNSILWERDRWQSWVDNMIDAGVKVFHLSPAHYEGKYGQSRFWTDEGVYPSPPAPVKDDAVTLEWEANYILSRVPDARFFVRLNSYAPKSWMEKNPGELQTDGAGKTYEPSWASQKYLDGMRGHYTNLVGWVEKQSWADRVLGYFVLPYGEGATLLSIHGHFYDHSAAMQKAWRDWLGKEYSSDADLQAAWGEDGVLRASAPIPDDAALRAKIETLPTWPDPKLMRRERDYATLQREIYGRYIAALTQPVKDAAKRKVIVGLDAMKQPLLGWQINEAFFGTHRSTDQFSLYLSSGSINVGPLLDLPSLDCIVTPADYTARGVGWGFEGEGLSDSLVLRGKSQFIENDARTWLAQETPDAKPPLGAFMTLPEVKAGLLRNSALAISRGLFYYWMDINYPTSYYTAPEIQREVARNVEVLKRFTERPHRETQHAIAMIIDDESLIYGNFTTGFNQLAVMRQRIEGLALAGIPYRIYLLSDLKKDNFPTYRCYLFPNLFKVDEDVLSLLKRKVFRDGSIAIFGPGTGITDGETISAVGAERVLQIPMKLHNGKGSRRVRLRRDEKVLSDPRLPPLYGDSLAYGPILAPDRERLQEKSEQNVRVLGDLVSTFQVNAPGLVLKEFGSGARGNGVGGARGANDYAVVFSASTPLPAGVLRSLAKYGGCNVWVDEDAVVSASDSFVSLHTTRSGKFRIHLPRRVGKVLNAETGQVVANKASEITVQTRAPDTRMYLLE